jgi:molecular chaperone DnaK (HSP70)
MSQTAIEQEGQTRSRFVVGIDLGTTNSALAFVDTEQERPSVQTFATPQLVAAGQVEARETLPSFHYHAAGGEFAAGALRLPWQRNDPDYAVGMFAQSQGELSPGRLVTSAKSWLCHAGVDRTAELLPWHGASDVPRLSPVEVSSRYLAHLRAAWNHRFAEHPLEEQDVVLTLPASFDEVARELTIKAAQLAGLPRVVLVEEPQAAFYAWIDSQGDDWESQVRPGQKILVCDIGGGTSDFTLIRVRRQSGGKVQFHRVAVGEHLILGGDNLDLALAHHVERKLVGDSGKLSPRQWGVLVQTSRRAKETLLGANAPERLVMNIPGSGARLIGGASQVEISRDEAQPLLIEGFLPQVALAEKPVTRRSGFQEFGLPYASDAAITRYLAAFLTAHRHAGDAADEAAPEHDPARPDIVLFNGGFFASELLRKRLLEVLGSWFPVTSDRAWSPIVLRNERLDLAVARGAAYYGMVRRGFGQRIAAGLARTYYIGVEAAPPAAQHEEHTDAHSAVCLLPAGVEEGQSVELATPRFELLIRQPVEFPLFSSSTRLTDPPGSIVPVDAEQMTALPPIRTVLQAGKKSAPAETLHVTLHARLTEIGTIDLWCGESEGNRSWRLQFDVRSATQTDIAGHAGAGERAGVVDEEVVERCRQEIRETFAPTAGKAAALKGGHSPEGIVKRLEQMTDERRAAWPPSLLRSLWEVLIEAEAGRRLSPDHEARWLYLVGFCLRPGYGMAVDDWRVAQVWRLVQNRLIHPSTTCRVEWLILWRRIAGGLQAGQQRSLAEPLLASLPTLAAGAKPGRKGASSGSHEMAEVWRLLGSCEWLPIPLKTQLGETLVARIGRERTQAMLDAMIWTLGRLGARVPMYGPLNAVVPVEVAASWIGALVALRQSSDSLPFALMQLARRTGDRYRDVSEDARRDAVDALLAQQAAAHLVDLVREGGELAFEEQGQRFGESLPRGLRIS